jgi:hypothetical protein
LERETARLKRFEEQDQPAFSRWIETELADALASFRESVAALHELEELTESVRVLATMRGIPLWRAYNEFVAARDAGTLDRLFADNAEEAGGDGESDDDDLLRAFAEFAQEVFGIDFDTEPDGSHQANGGWEWPGSTTHRTAAERSGDSFQKGLYRQLVRVLHPDSGGEPTAERQRLWEEVQDAYSWGDVHRLARLHAEVCQGQIGADRALDLDAMPIGDVMTMRRSIETRLRQARARLKEVRQEPSWGFCELASNNKSALARIRARLEMDLRADLAGAQAETVRLEQIVAAWKRGPRPEPRGGASRKKRPRRRRPRGEAHFHDSWIFD